MKRDFSGLNDVQMLARIIEAEAASEPILGKIAVGAVIDNRRKAGGYGEGFRGVITKPGQFSAINDVTGYAGGQGANSLFWREPGEDSLHVARAIVAGEYRDPTGGATHYYNPDIASPDWGGEGFQPIGHHVFGRADAGRGVRVADAGQNWREMFKKRAGSSEGAPSGGDWREMFRAKAGQQTSPKPEPQSVGAGLVDSVTQGVTLGQGRKLTALESAILGREPGGGTLDLFNYDQPFWDRYDAALGAESAQQDQFGEDNPYADAAAEIAGAVGPAFIAAPVAGAGLLARGGRALMRNSPAGIAVRAGSGGATRAGQFARAGAAGAGAGAVYGESEAEQGGVADRAISAGQGAAFGAAGGLAGQQLGITAGKVLSRIVGKPQLFDGNKITEAGRQALRNLGVDPDQISDEFARAWAARVKQAGGATDETARLAQADEFGIPLTRGQATGDEALISFEEAARNNARGQMAANAVKGIDDAARARVGQTVDDIAGLPDDAIGAAERVGGAVSGAARRAHAQGNFAYDAARNAGPAVVDARAVRGGFTPGTTSGDNLPALVDAPRFRGIVERAEEALSGVTLGKPAGKAAEAVNDLRALGENMAKAPDGTIGVDFSAIERIRSKLLRNQRNLAGNDRQASEEIGAVIGALDEWTEDVFDNALISGSDEALDALKKARATWKDYRQRFGPYKGQDADMKEAQRMIAQIAERDLTGNEIANWLWGVSKIGGKGASVRLVRRLKQILPAESREAAMEAVKAGAWRRVAESGTGEKFGLQRMSSRINDFVSGDGRALAAELFTPQERSQMTRFARALEIMIPPKTTTNPSRSGYEVARLGRDMMQAMGASLGLAAGGPAGGLGALVAGAVAKNVPDAARAMQVPATRALRREFQRTGRGGGAVGGGLAGQRLGDAP